MVHSPWDFTRRARVPITPHTHTCTPTFAQFVRHLLAHSPHNVGHGVGGAAVPQQRHLRPQAQHPGGGTGRLVLLILALLLRLVRLLLGRRPLPSPERVLILRTPVRLKAVRLWDTGGRVATDVQSGGLQPYADVPTWAHGGQCWCSMPWHGWRSGGGGSVLTALCRPC